MKTILLILPLLPLLLMSPAHAGLETWTRKDGKSAQLKLVDVSGSGGDLVGKFEMAGGKPFEMKIADLVKADAKRLEAAAKLIAEGGSLVPAASVFDAFFKDGLVKLDGGQMKPFTFEENPKKYFVFYHTASWCGPCQNFMPKLKAFADKHKASGVFEIIVVSQDDSTRAMTAYANAKKIEWPHIKYTRLKAFAKEFPQPGTGIPNIVITDLQGEIFQCSYKDGQYYGGSFPLMLLEAELQGQKSMTQPAK